MLLPIKDDNPTRRFPIVLSFIIAVNFAVFIYESLLPAPALQRLVMIFGVTPYFLFHPGQSPFEPGWLVIFTMVTAMFLHGGWSHLLGNMLFFWVFGNNIEEAEGPWRFLAFYFLAGFFATLVHATVFPGSHVPSIGASGAVAGILGAYIVLFPRARVITVVLPFVFLPFYMPTYIVIGSWFVLQMFSGAMVVLNANTAPIAFFAHIGGFLAGVMLVRFFKRRRFRVKEEYRW